MVCPTSWPVNVETTSEVPTTPLVVADNNMVEALRVELAKCKSYHKVGVDMLGTRKQGPRVEGQD